jgi:hypothetical protein
MKTSTTKKRTHSEAEDAAQESSPSSTPRPNPAKEWEEGKAED